MSQSDSEKPANVAETLSKDERGRLVMLSREDRSKIAEEMAVVLEESFEETSMEIEVVEDSTPVGFSFVVSLDGEEMGDRELCTVPVPIPEDALTLTTPVDSFEDAVYLLDRIAEPEDSGWASRFALHGDEYTLDDGTSVWVGAPDEIDDTYVFVGLKRRSGSYKFVDDGAENTLREALPY